MRLALLSFVLVIALLLVACSPAEAGRKFADKNTISTGITGQVINDVYNEDYCDGDADCKVGRLCQNHTCVAKHALS